jgi:2,3,4,5-tetrahydropyridine-2-carboxylate N-succinyltransferase
MGTLSGGGTTIISVGERCLIGANAGIGISLGNDCTVEAGLYVTAGTPLTVCGLRGFDDGIVIKAREVSGRDGLLLRRNGLTGAVEVHPNGAQWSGLNDVLHAN